ncbi:1928_t:CDS:2 [Diversispora eburnea]|uniref:1928_t:CDS:1 n=1 Tax=Diversispora eburnea TaxID=1213867 RepID=A0A9N8ZTI8_9GLOM|nr:1928_t:CDS:2 [Diversispora eburnea]
MTLDSKFKSYGQHETLISSIRNIIKDYPFESVFKEFLQNADDAGAKEFHVIVDSRSHPTSSLLCDGMKAWQGPAILIFNDARFKNTDFDSLMRIRVGGKQDDDTKIGKHGLGFNSCYHFTDVPSFISGDSIAFMDPQEKFLPKRNELPQRGIIGPFPKEGIHNLSERDQFVPYEGIKGIDFKSTFDGTLFRIPLRQRPSEISDRIFSAEEVLGLFKKIRSTVTSQFLFLRNIEKIEVSHISLSDTPFFKIDSLWKATVNGLDESIRSNRRHIVNGDVRFFQMEIELIDNLNNVQNDQWIIVTGAQPDPEDSELKRYAKRYRLLQSIFRRKDSLLSPVNEKQSDFKGRLFSTFSLPDTTCLSVHLNGTWAQGSDRARLLIEEDNDLPDMDHQKLNWNRHILLEFLPNLHCKLLEEIIKLQNHKKIDFKNCISKFWPFPLASHNFPKNEKGIQINDPQITYLASAMESLNDKSKVASCPSFNWIDVKILKDLDATQYGIHDYAFNDVDLPEKSDNGYVDFLNSVIDRATSDSACKITPGLKDFKFPNAFTEDLMPISELYNYDNIVFRTVFGRNSNVFLHFNLVKHAKKLTNIGFNGILDSKAFNRCALKIEEMQEMGNPPPDIRHRGFMLVDHFYSEVNYFKEIDRIPFVPIAKYLHNPYDKYYNHPQVLDCFNNIILPQYKGVAWSQKALIAEDVIPPPNVLKKYPSLGKPSDITVIKQLKFLRNKLINDEEWRNYWKETFVSNVFEVYEWLEKKCLDESLMLRRYITADEPLFLNLNKSHDPFDTDNWVSANNLVLNAEPGEDKYINPRLAKYYLMLKSAGVQEIKTPSVKIQVREHDQSSTNKKVLLGILSNQMNSLHDVVFNVKGEKVWTNRIMLAASSEFFHQKFTPGGEYANSNPVTIVIDDEFNPTSVRILLHYLYGQNIDNAILNHQNTANQTPNFVLYGELLALAIDYELYHLKELMELKLSRMVTRSNVNNIKDVAENLNASQLGEYCECYIDDNENL